MDDLERQRHLQRELAAPSRVTAGLLGLGVSLLAGVVLVGCVTDDPTTATFGGSTAQATLPPVTEAPTTQSTAEADDGSANDDATTALSSSTTTTVQLDPLSGLAADLVADGFDQPVHVTTAPGSDGIYVVERKGVIRVVVDGAVEPEPFIDLTDRLLSSSIEQGLLGLAFHPDFADNGRFYAYWTGPDGASTLAEFTTTDPLSAQPDSQRLILTVDQPGERHNAGMVLFGPDGLLYVAFGDGGSGGGTAQDTSSLLGTIVRIDVDGPNQSGDRPYAIPPGNPFGSEIWVYGLRNPWRFSIDAETDLMYIGDVGQEAFEEINVVGLDGAGTNFGWIEMEGDRCFRSGCDPDRFAPPVLQYSHDDGCSVTGGWVYRGAAIPEFEGHYFYGDWCKGWVRSFRYDEASDQVVDQFDWSEDLAVLGQVTSFGLDPRGELLVTNWDGQLHRIVPVRS